jgi:hypothetical protein
MLFSLRQPLHTATPSLIKLYQVLSLTYLESVASFTLRERPVVFIGQGQILMARDSRL